MKSSTGNGLTCDIGDEFEPDCCRRSDDVNQCIDSRHQHWLEFVILAIVNNLKAKLNYRAKEESANFWKSSTFHIQYHWLLML